MITGRWGKPSEVLLDIVVEPDGVVRGVANPGRQNAPIRRGHFDAATGAILWQTRLPQSAQGFPITYSANGKQYVAMPAGYGGGSWSTLITPELAPEIRRPNGGNVLMVFALPDAVR